MPGISRRFLEQVPLAAEIIELRPYAREQKVRESCRDVGPLQDPDFALLSADVPAQPYGP